MRNIRAASGALIAIVASALMTTSALAAEDETLAFAPLPLQPAVVGTIVQLDELHQALIVPAMVVAPPAPARPDPSLGTLLEAGIASTYGTGDGFQGNRTACGQIFDTHVPQVAHKTLPCGTKVRVEDVDSGDSVVVEVTDRGPYIKGRVVDLSWAAFRKLDPSGPGLLNVNVYVLPE
jgi:rare lipoprotein A